MSKNKFVLESRLEFEKDLQIIRAWTIVLIKIGLVLKCLILRCLISLEVEVEVCQSANLMNTKNNNFFLDCHQSNAMIYKGIGDIDMYINQNKKTCKGCKDYEV